MKKRLLFVAVAMFAAASSFAQAIGEYVYTATQRVKIVGDNAVTNGSFESANTEGWTNAAGEAVDGEVWSVEDGVGANGENALMSVNGTTDGAAACRAFDLAAGSYVVMYDIKGDNTAVTGIVDNNSSVVNIFLTNSGTLSMQEGDVQVSDVNGYKDTWKTVAYQFEAIDGQKLVIRLEKLAANTMITNIKIFPSQLVYDDRVLKTKLDYVDKLIATKKFILDTENSFIENVVGTMRDMLNGSKEGALDDISGTQALIDAYESELKLWYDLNAADLLKDEKRWSAYGDTRKKDGIGGNWKGTGGRWFHLKEGGSTEITNDGDEIGHRYQGSFEGNASQYYTITPSFAGTYMFSLDMVGHYMTGTSGKSKTYTTASFDNYTTDWNRDFKGVTMYAGKDIMGADAEANAAMNNEQEGQKIDCGYINNPNAKNNPQKFVVFYEVSQEMVDAKTPVTFGITYIIDPDRGFTSKLGSNVNIANPQIRLIGVTQAVIDFQNEVNKIIVQQGPLKERLQWANDDMAKTAADGYPWGKAALKEAIDHYQPVYDASLTVVDAEGNVLNEAFIKEQITADVLGEGILYSDSLLNSVKAMNSARSAFSNINKPIANYRQKIADAEAVRDDAMNSLGDKTTFQAAIDAAQMQLNDVLAITTDETREADEATLTEALGVLATAVETFKESAALEPFIDIDFSNGFEEIKDAEEQGTGDYMIKGAKGQMEFSSGSVNVADNTGAPNEKGVGTMDFALGCNEELLDVLRIGNGTATVNVPEGVVIADDEVVRFDFNIWFVQLSAGMINIELLNAADQRLAGFGYCAYGNPIAELNYNTFNNEANEGLDLAGFATNNKAGDVASHVDGNKNSFSLIIDYKAKGVQGIMVTTKGTCTGKVLPLNTVIDETTTIEDTKVAKFRLTSNYGSNGGGNYVGRRCWFDDLKAFKYPSQAEGPVGIKTIENVENAPVKGIFNLQGQRVEKAVKGLYIINGKKVVMK